jgi:ssRNA-specific RNase YbeY (16S rRNA maturation enzyme)
MENISAKLTHDSIKIIRQCLYAATEGPFFPDWEFETLFGINRDLVRSVYASWPETQVNEKELIRAIIGSMGHLLGYPHGHSDLWFQYIPVTHERVNEVLNEVLEIDFSNKISKAIVLYLGYGVVDYPDSNSSYVTNEFGDEILRSVQKIIQDLKNLHVDWSLFSVVSGTKWAISEIKKKHTSINDQATDALEWAYSHGL